MSNQFFIACAGSLIRFSEQAVGLTIFIRFLKMSANPISSCEIRDESNFQSSEIVTTAAIGKRIIFSTHMSIIFSTQLESHLNPIFLVVIHFHD